MKRFFIILICILCIGTVAQAAEWQKFVAKDKTYSFHYPKGWKLNETDSIIEISNPAQAGQQMLVVALNGDKKKTARQIANNALAMFKQGMPDIEASNWTDHDAEGMCTFQVSFTDNGTPNTGHVLVMNSQGQAMWFSIAGPKAHYDTQKSVYLLQGVVGSLAAGTGSQPPKPEAGTTRIKRTPEEQAKLNKTAKAFIFVVSFGLGTPFTTAQEKVIMDELMDGWSYRTMDELDKYSKYQDLVAAIMKANKNDMETLRQSMEQAIREWLSQVDQNDPGVKVVRNQLNASSKTLVDGDPPLSEMAATSYAEMMAYTKVLKKNPNGTPDQISPAIVAEYRGRIIRAWPNLGSEGKADACTMPGLWMTMRQVLRAGTPAEQSKIRSTLAKVGGADQSSGSGRSSGSHGSHGSSTSKQLAKNMIMHNTLMMAQQQTFNTYMWSRGFSGWTPMGKSW